MRPIRVIFFFYLTTEGRKDKADLSLPVVSTFIERMNFYYAVRGRDVLVSKKKIYFTKLKDK